LYIIVFKLYGNKVGDNVVKTINIIGIKSLGFVLDIIIGSKSLILGLQFAINGEPENAAQRGIINLLPSGLINVGNIFGLFGQVVFTTLTHNWTATAQEL